MDALEQRSQFGVGFPLQLEKRAVAAAWQLQHVRKGGFGLQAGALLSNDRLTER